MNFYPHRPNRLANRLAKRLANSYTEDMAKHVDPARVTTIKPGARAVYPWATWTDGEWWQLHEGDDYVTTTEVFQAVARNYARRNGFRLEVKLTEDGTLIRFTPKQTESTDS